MNVSAVLNCPSLTVTVMVALPLWWAAGVIVTVRSAPLPPKTMLPPGISAGLEELPLTMRLAAGVWLSPTVKAIGPATLSSAIVTSPTSEIVGGALTGGGPDDTTRATDEPGGTVEP